MSKDLEKEFEQYADLSSEFESYDAVAEEGLAETDPTATGDVLEPLEAYGRHAVDTTLMGLPDIPIAAVEALIGEGGDLFKEGEEFKYQELLDRYYKSKGEQRGRRSELMEKQPVASWAGIGTGALASPIPGSALAKGGKLAQGAAKLFPSMKGFDKIKKLRNAADISKTIGRTEKTKELTSLANKAEKAFALREGVKVGGVAGFASGDSKLLEGDIGGTAGDVATGSALGGGLGLGLTSGKHMLTAMNEKLPILKNMWDSFIQGVKGKHVDDSYLNEQTVKFSKKFYNDIAEEFKKKGIQQDDIIKTLDDVGITINTAEDLKQARDIISKISRPDIKKKAQEILNIIDDYVGGGKKTEQIKLKLAEEIDKSYIKNPMFVAKQKQAKKALKNAIEQGKAPSQSGSGVVGADDVLPDTPPSGVKARVREDVFPVRDKTGKIVPHSKYSAEDVTPFEPTDIETTVGEKSGKQMHHYTDKGSGKTKVVVGDTPNYLDAENLSAKEANELKQLLRQYTELESGASVPPEVKQIAKEASVKISSKLDDASLKIGKDLKNVNRQLRELYKVKGWTGMEKAKEYDDAIREINKFALGDIDVNSLSKTQSIIESMKKVNPKLAVETAKELEKLRYLAELIDPKTNSHWITSTQAVRVVVGSVQKVANNLANFVGRGVGEVGDLGKALVSPKGSTLAKVAADFTRSSKDQLSKLASKVASSDNKAYQSFLKPLKEAIESPDRRRAAILYMLYNQPAFREMLRDSE